MLQRVVNRLALLLPLHLSLACTAISPPATRGCGPEVAPLRDLEATSLHYRGTFTVAGLATPATSSVTVTPHPAGGWAVTERAQLPRGVAMDSARLDAHTLAPRERVIQQGTTHVALRFADQHATGTITKGAQVHPISVDLCGSLVGDGAGAFLVIGRLPLGAGYHTIVRHLDMQTAKTTVRRLSVIGSERVSVPAGSFDSWKVEISDADNATPSTIWIDKTTLVPVKFSASQGTVTIAMELESQGGRPTQRLLQSSRKGDSPCRDLFSMGAELATGERA